MSDSNSRLSHVNAAGEANMVDVSAKEVTARRAVAEATVHMQAATLEAIEDNAVAKGEVLAIARVAGIQAAKRCADLIPLCHPLPLSKVEISFTPVDAQSLRIEAECRVTGQTGVEMEALTAASVAALTIYDMCKAMDKGMTVDGLGLVTKSGGKSGDWQRGASS